jgi:hypothetical protein
MTGQGKRLGDLYVLLNALTQADELRTVGYWAYYLIKWFSVGSCQCREAWSTSWSRKGDS